MRRGMAVLLLALLLSPAGRGEELAPWDGREVMELAKQLRDQVAAAALAADTSMPQSSLAQHAMRDRARKRLAGLSEATEQLVTQLVQTQGPDRTRATFERVREQAAPVQRFMDEERPTRKLRFLWADAQASLERLSRYYPPPGGADGSS